MSRSKEYAYPSFAIHDLIKQTKNSLKEPMLQKYREEGRKYDIPVYLADEERFVPMRLKVSAGQLDEPHTYEAAFIVDSERVRGVGYCEVSKKRHYKGSYSQRVASKSGRPKSWR